MAAIIDLQDIVKVYQTGDVKVRAVCGVSLTIQPGAFVAIMGASGSGKSTMMNILGCLDQPTSGLYLLDGMDVSQLSPEERAEIRNEKIGFVFQGFNLLARTSARDNIELPMLYAHPPLSRKEQVQRVDDALEIVGLTDRADHLPNQLSGGQQQRVAIARSLVMKPALLLADEPTGNLDTQTSIEIMDAFQTLNDRGITIAMVTHELDIAQYTKRNVVMRDGKIISDRLVENRLNAKAEMERLQREQRAADLAS
ncbi:MAG: putative ABC transporter ATP-binding protein YknY [Verrucomicrobia subdivision 3 bacterium]|nr:putative ABC transporter ATP-binding protein YknY [Limisphaerales bacterium]MCS1414363.1 putative ABC transporter ATP-binding protein YknY [Limisphaerales bacterium]